MTELSFVLAIAGGLAKVLANPVFYVALLLVYVQYQRQNNIERRMFGVKCTSLGERFLRSLLFGIVGGLLATILLTVVGVVLSPVDLTYVWILAFVLSVFNVRYICFAYAGGLLSVVSLILQTLPVWYGWPGHMLWLHEFYVGVCQLHVPQLMALVAILHLVEALLVRWNGDHQPMPVFVSGKRGRLIGGFLLQKFWVVPMSAFVFTDVGNVIHAPSWWPLMSGAGTVVAGIAAVPFPAILGYSSAALTATPRQKTVTNFKYLMAYSLVLLGLAIASSYVSPLSWVAALFCPVAHEILILWELHEEQSGSPAYVRPIQGLKILAVLPNSPAAAMGLLSGETIVRVNGTPVNTPYDLHFALNQNPAFAKLDLLTPEGELRFAQRPIYMGDHHALGIVLVPDDQARQYVRLGTGSPWRSVWDILTGAHKKHVPPTYH